MSRPRPVVLFGVLFGVLSAPALWAQTGKEAAKPSPELFMAIGQQNSAAVKELLAHGVSANTRNSLDMSALMIASATGNVANVNALLAAGAEVNAASPFGTPVLFATQTGQSEVVRILLEKGATVAATRPDRTSALMLAARAGDPALVRLLLDRKAELNGTDIHGSTALSYAARAGKTEAARVLLAAGAKPDAADLAGWTPLMHAAVNGRADTTALLLEKGADLKAADKRGRTALQLATSYGDHPEVVRVLLARHADVRVKDLSGRTALDLAETRGYTGSAKLLKEAGARTVADAAVRTPRKAVQASLPRIELTMQQFAKRTGCASCHHEGLGAMTTGIALAHGYSINKAFAQEQAQRVGGFFQSLQPQLHTAAEDPSTIKNLFVIDVGDGSPSYGSLLLSLAEHRTPSTAPLQDAAAVLARLQTPDGDWRFGFQREPVQSSFFTMTAMALRSLQAYAPKQMAGEVAERTGRAKHWLLTAPVTSTEDRVFRLLGLKWAGATAEERRKALDELRATQRPDGGWAQDANSQSDAYATGSALFALNQGGDLAVADAAYQRGVRYLLRTQEDDGTWYVYKRATPLNNYFDAGFPYGQSQYASFAGTCWASMALMLAEEGPAKATARAQ